MKTYHAAACRVTPIGPSPPLHRRVEAPSSQLNLWIDEKKGNFVIRNKVWQYLSFLAPSGKALLWLQKSQKFVQPKICHESLDISRTETSTYGDNKAGQTAWTTVVQRVTYHQSASKLDGKTSSSVISVLNETSPCLYINPINRVE